MGKGSSQQQQAPSSQTVTNTSIPEYARPYVENMLGKSEALTDVNQNPYQVYGGDRIAGFSPLQQQVFQNVANQTTSPQLDYASGMAGAAGMNAMNAGRDYQRMATNPYATQAYMNPYLSASLQPQLNEIQRQADITGQGLAGQATRAGAFGGNRAALQQAENQRNALMAKQQAIGQGYNQAFQQAQQAQQFGANLGMQGQQAGLQAAGTLGQLGQTQFAQQQGINQAQQQVGAVEQAQQQQQLDQAYQDYLKQKNYPYQQLAFMSDMLRGLPLSQSSQQIYTAPPNAASQLGGLGMAGLGIYGMSGGFNNAGKASGGVIKMAKGGLASYGLGGKIDFSMMSDKQLQEALNDPELTPMEVEQIENLLMVHNRIRNNPEASKMIAGMNQPQAGLNAIPMQGAKAGGIMGYSGDDESKVKDNQPRKSPQRVQNYEKWLEGVHKQQMQDLIESKPFTKSEEMSKGIQADMEERKRNRPYELLANMGFGTMAGKSQYGLQNLGEAGKGTMETMAKLAAEDAADRKLLLQQGVEAEKAEFGRRAGIAGATGQQLANLYNREVGLAGARAAGANAAATANSLEYTRTLNSWQNHLKNTAGELLKNQKQGYTSMEDPKLISDAYAYAYKTFPAKGIKILDLQPVLPINPAAGGNAPPAPQAGGGGDGEPPKPPGYH
mgnify:CR=1 FL=1